MAGFIAKSLDPALQLHQRLHCLFCISNYRHFLSHMKRGWNLQNGMGSDGMDDNGMDALVF